MAIGMPAFKQLIYNKIKNKQAAFTPEKRMEFQKLEPASGDAFGAVSLWLLPGNPYAGN
jgi:hypothetical protein